MDGSKYDLGKIKEGTERKRLGKELEDKIKESVKFIRNVSKKSPQIGIILGTGLGNLTNNLKKKKVIPYRDIPHFPLSTTPSHKGNMILGLLEKERVVMMEGRFHYYEGYSLDVLTFPIRVLKGIGIEILIITNSSGGLNPQFSIKDIMIISDHINLMGDNPLRGANLDSQGPRFPIMVEPYSKRLIGIAEEVGRDLDIPLKKGVYVGVSGPSLETPAEIRFLRMIGADAVGMSTIPEVIVANHAGIKVLGLSVISNLNDPDHPRPAPIEEIIKVAEEASPLLDKIVRKILRKIGNIGKV